jgi:hypothetical protein
VGRHFSKAADCDSYGPSANDALAAEIFRQGRLAAIRNVLGGRSIAYHSDAERVPKKSSDEDENNNTGWNDDWRYEPLNHDQPPLETSVRKGEAALRRFHCRFLNQIWSSFMTMSDRRMTCS